MFFLQSLFIEVFLLSIAFAGGLLIVLIGKELCQHTLDVVQGLLLSPESLLLSLHAAMENILIIVIGHVGQYKSYLDRADGARRSIAANFLLI